MTFGRIFVLCLLVTFCWYQGVLTQLSTDPDKLLNWCLSTPHHKTRPGKESSLYNQCSPWKDRSCCTENTSQAVHTQNMYNFNYNFCKPNYTLSAKCKRHFIQDLCFHECEPNIGPWVVKVKRKIANERFLNVPLCKSDCDSWWLACANDFTCVYNWPRNFAWIDGNNHCPKEAKCKPFYHVYRDSKDFCENVWDHSWVVVPDNELCMRIWFNGSQGNPNKHVAEVYVEKLLAGNAYSVTSHFFVITICLLSLFI